jgi:FAD/FMN-containing dehydrogenase
VGFAGHTLHGGFGLTSRMWGITLDMILSMQVVLADGRIVDASESENEELFWVHIHTHSACASVSLTSC